MIRFAIAMFLLLLFGVAVEELAVRSAGGPSHKGDCNDDRWKPFALTGR